MAIKEQSAIIYDIISEGPIQGLVNGPASVYLDGTPIVDENVLNADDGGLILTPLDGYAAVKGTPDTRIVISDSDYDLTALDLSSPRQIILLKNSTGLCNFAATDYWTLNRTSGATFSSLDRNQIITIKGSGAYPDARNVIETIIDANTVKLKYPVIVSGSSITFETSITAYITSVVNATTIVVDKSIAATTNSRWYISSVLGNEADPGSNTAIADGRNFASASYFFRTGTKSQPPPAPAVANNYGGNSFVGSFNEELKQTTRDDGSLTYKVLSKADNVIKSAVSDMGISNPAETDRVKVIISSPAMFVVDPDGEKWSHSVELQIYFEYKRAGTWYNSGDDEPANTLDAWPYFGVSDQYIDDRPADPSVDGKVTKYSIATGDAAFQSAQVHNTGRIKEMSTSSFVTEFTMDTEPFKPYSDWRVRLKRVTGDEVVIRDGQQGQHKTYLQSIVAYTKDVLTYPFTAYAGVVFQSNEFGSFPERAYLCEGMLVQVPTNYITRTESSTGIASYNRNVTTGVDTGTEQQWDGKFRGDISDTSWNTDSFNPNYGAVYTNNPAWIYYDILVNNRYGLGEYLDKQNINKYELYRIARYCDELVPDGKSGLEPRFACNIYLTAPQEAYKILNDLASVFRSVLLWLNGQIVLNQDNPKGSMYTFTQSNVLNGEFSYESSAKRLRVNQVAVTWTDPEKFYKRNVELVDDDEDIIEQNRITRKDIVALGCTSQGQAHRLGKWMIFTEKEETSFIKFKTGINAHFLRPGDIISVQDQQDTRIFNSGRTSNTPSTTTTIYLDRDVVIGTGTYDLHLVVPGGAAYLQETSAVLDGNILYKGDIIVTAGLAGSPGTPVSINSEETASNVVDDSNNHVLVSWAPSSSVETRRITNGASTVSNLTVSTAFTSAPGTEVIWAISDIASSSVNYKVKKYRILSIAENSDNTFDIGGHLYLEHKFDYVDRGYELTQITNSSVPIFDGSSVPVPTQLAIHIAPTGVGDLEDGGITTSYYKASINWGTPLQPNSTDPYQYLKGFEVKHDFNVSRKPETIFVGDVLEYTITGGDLFDLRNVSVRTVDILNRKSQWVSKVMNNPIASYSSDMAANKRINKLNVGGIVNVALTINSATGALSFSNPNFSIITNKGLSVAVVGASAVDFSDLTLNEAGYLVWDNSASAFIALEVYTDTTILNGNGETYNPEFWKRTSHSTGLSLTSRTTNQAIAITQTYGVNTVTEYSNTIYLDGDPSSDFSVGDLIKLGTGTSAWLGSVAKIHTASPSYITTNFPINKAFSSGTAVYKQEFVPDYGTDFIVARVDYEGSIPEFALVPIMQDHLGATAGFNLYDADGNIITDNVITNFDDASAMGFNPAFALWPAGDLRPTGWNNFEDAGTNGNPTKDTVNKLVGPYGVKFTVTDASTNDGISHRSSIMEFDVNSVLVGSYDCFIGSYADGSPGLNAVPGILVEMRVSNSPVSYIRSYVTADATIIGSWQRVPFKLSIGDYSDSSSPFPASNFTSIAIWLMAEWGTAPFNGGWNGNITYDNVRFALLDPTVANENVTWGALTGKPAGVYQILYQAGSPSSGMSDGDYWIDSDDNKMYRYTSPTWFEVQDDGIGTAIVDAQTAQSTADGKIYVFAQTGSPLIGGSPVPGLGDLWIDTNDNNKLYRFNGSSWVEYAQEAANWDLVFGSGKPDDNANINVDTFNLNGSFQNWSTTYPTGWLQWSAAGITKETGSPILTGANSVKFSPTGADQGMRKVISNMTLPLDTVLEGTFDVYIASHSAGVGPSMMIHMGKNGGNWIRAYANPDTSILNRWQTVSWTLADTPALYGGKSGTLTEIDEVIFYVMASWTGFASPSPSTGTYYFDNVQAWVSQTHPAIAGYNLLTNAGTLLEDIDVRNDQLVTDALSAMNYNPSMSIPADRNGVLGPAGYTTNGSGVYPTYESDVTRDVLVMGTTNIAVTMSAMQVTPGAKYEVTARVKSLGASVDLDLRVYEYNTALLPDDVVYIGNNLSVPNKMIAYDTLLVRVNDQPVGSPYELITEIYTPSTGAKWFSPGITNNGLGISYAIDWWVVRQFGATAGADIFNEAGVVLADIDLRNDQLVTDALSAVNFNPSFSIPADRATGLAPAGYALSGISHWPFYADNIARDVMQMSGATVSEAVLMSAMAVTPGMKYEISALIWSMSTTHNIYILAYATDIDLPIDKKYIGPSTRTDAPIQINTNIGLSDLGSVSVTSSPTLVTKIWTPRATDKWFSPALYDNGASIGYKVDWWVVRPYGATLGTDLFYSDGSTITGDDLINYDFATALGNNPSFSDWTGTYPAGWVGWVGSLFVKDFSLKRTGSNSIKFSPVIASGTEGIQTGIKTLDLPSDVVIEGSVDVYYTSHTSGGVSGILLQINTSASNGFRVHAKASNDPALIGKWQRVAFTLSKKNYTELVGTPTATGRITEIQAWVIASWASFGGLNTSVVNFDNFIYSVKPALTGLDAPVTLPNWVPFGYSTFEKFPTGTQSHAFIAPSGSVSAYTVEASNPYTGANAVKLVTSATQAGVYLSSSSSAYNCKIPPNRRWAVLYRVKCNRATSTWKGDCRMGTTPFAFISSGVFTQVSAADTYTLIGNVVDLSTYSDTAVIVRLISNTNLVASDIAYLDNVSLVDITDHPHIVQANLTTMLTTSIEPGPSESIEPEDIDVTYGPEGNSMTWLRTVDPSGSPQSWYTPYDYSVPLTTYFRYKGTIVGQQVMTGLLGYQDSGGTPSSGKVDVTEGTDTYSNCTAVISNDNTSFVSVVITHTPSGKTAYNLWTVNLPGTDVAGAPSK